MNILFRCISCTLIILGLSFSTSELRAQNQDPVEFCIEWSGGNRFDFKVKNFTDVRSMQMSIKWDTVYGSFLAVDQMADIGLNQGNFGSLLPGIAALVWFQPGIESAILDDGDILFSLLLEHTNAALALPSISNSPLNTEITFDDGSSQSIIEMSSDCPTSIKGLVTGRVIFDKNQNCSIDTSDTPLPTRIIEFNSGSEKFYANSNTEGNYWAWLEPGEYSANIVANYDLFDFCNQVIDISVDTMDSDTINFFATAIFECPEMQVSLTTNRIRGCFDSRFILTYCNLGTVTGESAYIDLIMDERMGPISSGTPYIIVSEDKYRFELGDVEMSDCGTIKFYSTADCDIELNLTVCNEARIYPNDLCGPANASWSGASIEVKSGCIGDEIIFSLENPTEFDMRESRHVAIIRNDAGYDDFEIKYLAGESQEFRIVSDGATYRIIADQVRFHPGQSNPTTAIEACGVDIGNADLGFITQFNNDDEDPSVDIFCLETIGSFDPNDKLALPKGSLTEHFILPAKSIDYTIRFQNTGSDTAYRVVVIDTLDVSLDARTIRNLASSHGVDMELHDKSILRFSFENILLPDSNVNLLGSQGFVSFQINPVKDLALGTRFANKAGIYFDFNEPIITNEIFHTISADFIDILSADNVIRKTLEFSVYPNPSHSNATLTLREIGSDIAHGTLVDVQGVSVWSGMIINNQIDLRKSLLKSGMYFLIVENSKKEKYAARLMIQD